MLPIVLLLVGMESLLRNIPNDYSYKSNFLDSASSKIQVLFLGNSHSYFGLNPLNITLKAFNVAHVSQSLNIDLAILNKFNNKWDSLKYIIVPIDYFTMYSSLEITKEKWRLKNYSLYYKLPLKVSGVTNYEILEGQENLTRIVRYYLLGESNITTNSYGWGTNYNSVNKQDLVKTGKTAAERHTTSSTNTTCFISNMQNINALYEFSFKKNIQLIFVTFPAYKTYTENLNRQQLIKTVNFIKNFSLHKKQTYYYNFLNDTSFKETDFYDADHLNEKGASKMTLKIDSIIENQENVKRILR